MDKYTYLSSGVHIFHRYFSSFKGQHSSIKEHRVLRNKRFLTRGLEGAVESLKLRLSPLTEEVLQVISYPLSVFLTGSDMRLNENVQVPGMHFALQKILSDIFL
jgi:hypothetical protein